MPNTRKLIRDFYSEAEAARMLGISLSNLRALLDHYIFTDGTPRPSNLELLSTDLLLLRFWLNKSPDGKLLPMPRRE